MGEQRREESMSISEDESVNGICQFLMLRIVQTGKFPSETASVRDQDCDFGRSECWFYVAFGKYW
jgi:hypothetical protein